MRYHASDIGSFTVGTLNKWFGQLQVADRFIATIGDLMTEQPEPADVAFLLKVLPCLEAQAKGAGWAALDRQAAKYLVVSYPLKSVSGREKGMDRFYREQLYSLVQDTGGHVDELSFPNELVFILQPSAPRHD